MRFLIFLGPDRVWDCIPIKHHKDLSGNLSEGSAPEAPARLSGNLSGNPEDAIGVQVSTSCAGLFGVG